LNEYLIRLSLTIDIIARAAVVLVRIGRNSGIGRFASGFFSRQYLLDDFDRTPYPELGMVLVRWFFDGVDFVEAAGGGFGGFFPL